MFVIDRLRGGTDDVPEETIDMAGTTGNIYRVIISHVPSCTCPDHQKGNQCKHIIYVSFHVFRTQVFNADLTLKGAPQCPQGTGAFTISIGIHYIRMS